MFLLTTVQIPQRYGMSWHVPRNSFLKSPGFLFSRSWTVSNEHGEFVTKRYLSLERYITNIGVQVYLDKYQMYKCTMFEDRCQGQKETTYWTICFFFYLIKMYSILLKLVSKCCVISLGLRQIPIQPRFSVGILWPISLQSSHCKEFSYKTITTDSASYFTFVVTWTNLIVDKMYPYVIMESFVWHIWMNIYNFKDFFDWDFGLRLMVCSGKSSTHTVSCTMFRRNRSNILDITGRDLLVAQGMHWVRLEDLDHN